MQDFSHTRRDKILRVVAFVIVVAIVPLLLHLIFLWFRCWWPVFFDNVVIRVHWIHCLLVLVRRRRWCAICNKYNITSMYFRSPQMKESDNKKAKKGHLKPC